MSNSEEENAKKKADQAATDTDVDTDSDIDLSEISEVDSDSSTDELFEDAQEEFDLGDKIYPVFTTVTNQEL